jgi:hypothetical protein
MEIKKEIQTKELGFGLITTQPILRTRIFIVGISD